MAVKTNERAQVIDNADTPIKGLYAGERLQAGSSIITIRLERAGQGSHHGPDRGCRCRSSLK